MDKLLKYSKLSNYQIRKVIEYFALELTAVQTSKHLKLNRKTVDRIYQTIREKIANYQEINQNIFHGEVEMDESYFGGRHKYNRGRSVKSKIPVFGLLKRNGKVYTQIVPNVKRETLMKIIRTKVIPESLVYTDSWKSYDGLVLDGYKHFRINHSKKFVKGKKNHINGIESFWSYAKNKLNKHYGIHPKRFYFYLKEQEFRFNNRKCQNLAKLIEKILINY